MKKQILAITIGLLTIGSFAQKKELKIAEKALKTNDFNGALTAISSIESSITSADAKYQSKFYYLKGKALVGKKEYSKAVSVFDQLLAFETTSGKKTFSNEVPGIKSQMSQEVSNEAIDLYNNKKNFKEAAEKFYLTYTLSPNDTSFVYNAAVSATQAKDYDLALKYYNKLRKLGYTGIELQYVATSKVNGKVENLGSKRQRDLMVKSGTYIKPAVKTTESKYALIIKNVALILKEQGRTEEAIKAMQEARKANPKDLNLILNEAQLYIEMKRMDEYSELISQAIALDPKNATLYYNLGVVSFNQGRVKEAKDYYNKAIELKPDYADAYMNLAVATLDEDKAIVEEMNKNLSNFKKYDELALKQKGVYQEALPYLEKADGFKRSRETVRTLMSIYDVLEMTEKAKEFRALYKSMQ